MSKYPSFSRYESGAASARVRDELARLRHHMRSEAILGEAIARLATQMNIRPGEAAERPGPDGPAQRPRRGGGRQGT